MAEQIIVLMADWDEGTQKALGAIYEDLQKEGFTGKQTPGIPYHISMSTYPIDKEAEAEAHFAVVLRPSASVELMLLKLPTHWPAKWIEQYVTTQAKRLIKTHATQTLQEIAYMLGFSEPTSFYRYFKHVTGMTAKEYRDRAAS